MSEETKIALKAVTELAEAGTFQPSPAQQSIKAQFWSRAGTSPLLDQTNINLTTVQLYVQDARIKKYWEVPGFREWFLNQEETKERLDYLWMAGLDAAEQILRDPSAPAASKVNLLKVLAEIQGYISKGGKGQAVFSDDQINKMGEKELTEWLERRGVKTVSKKGVEV